MTDKQETHISWYVVAFLDLLGQQEKHRQLTVLPNRENPQETAEFMGKVKEIYQPVKALRKFFADSINNFTKPDNAGLFQKHEKEFLEIFRSTPIVVRTFSDSVIAHVPLIDSVAPYPCRALYGVLSGTAITFLSCLAWGNPIRGGIDLGLAINLDDDEIYGPALANAYSLESKIAHYPRIVIGSELVNYLRVVMASEPSSDLERANSFFAKACFELLVQDDDGYVMLDYLGEKIATTLQDVPKTGQLITKAYDFVIAESLKHKTAMNSKLGFRYTLLRNYFDARLHYWGVELESEV